jgi:retron-type reverse transcriptase
MKTHKRLWDKFISRENFAHAAFRALRNKVKTSEIKRFMRDMPGNTERVRRLVESGKFTTSEYRVKTIFEPKRREIFILPFMPDRIIHHALMNILMPIWDAMFSRDSYCCRPGYGIHSASLRTMQFVRRNKYFLQCDVRKFYPSIDHNVMYNIIARKVADKKILAIVRDIIDSTPGEVNLPIGNFCSQWFGNLYLNELDTFVKQVLRVPDYVRYCDDFCLFSNDKKVLHGWLAEIRKFLADKLKLTFSYAEVSQTSAGVDFMGYRHFPKFVKLRKSTMRRVMRRIKRLERIPIETRRADIHIRSQIASIHGWAKHASHDMRLPRI